MSVRLRRILAVLLTLSAFATLAVATLNDWANPDFVRVGYDPHPLGPVGPADRDLLIKVKQAGLWEMPVGIAANERAVTPRLREVGAKIAAEHHELDRLVEAAAAQLGVVLPTEPSDEQKAWIREIDSQQGVAFDKRAVFLLRFAHGNVLPLLTAVRTGTRNGVVRDHAEQAMTFVLRHINYLESTGLVDFEALPEPPAPTPNQQPAQASYLDTHDLRTLVVALVVIATVAALMFLVVRTLVRQRPKSARPPPPSEAPPPKAGPKHARRPNE